MPLVEEVASKSHKATHGWAYVPDTGYDPSKAPIVPAGTKRTASGVAIKAIAASQSAAPTPSSSASGGQPLTLAALHDPSTSARQNTQLARRLAELDRDIAPGVTFNAPGKSGAGRAKGKTPATRKILAAQKTFVNYLADEEAMAAQGAAAAAAAAAVTKAERARLQAAQTTLVPPPNSASSGARATAQAPPPPPPLGPGAEDDARLVQVVVPRAPSDALMARLTGAPPLSYGAARALADARDPPRRHFCEWCGHWGTIRCRACGARVCGLECYQTHTKERCLGL